MTVRYSRDTLEKYAELLWFSLGLSRGRKFKKSDLVLVAYDLAALPLAEVVVESLHERGMVPVIRPQPSERMIHDGFALANNKRLLAETPGERELRRALAGRIRIEAPESLTSLADIEPQRIVFRETALLPQSRSDDFRERHNDLGATVAVYPTPALAVAAAMDMEEYAHRLELACLLERGTPLTDWKRLSLEMAEVRAWLDSLGAVAYRLQSERSDLLLKPGQSRRWVALSGANTPSFELYLSPDWRATEGAFHADLPCWRMGRLFQGVTLTFRMGEVVAVSADQGQAEVFEQLRLDQGANRLGEFALVDRRFSPIDRPMAHPLLDENMGGAHGVCHIALGQACHKSFAGDARLLTPQLARELGFNASGVHWDLVSAEPRTIHAIAADGSRTLIYENGEFRY